MKRPGRLAWILVGLIGALAGVTLMVQPWETQAQSGQGAGARFAEDRAGNEKTVPFDSKRAMEYLKKICDLGPRISGSEGMKKQQELLKAHFAAAGAKVELQRFTARQRSQKEPVEMANFIAQWHPDRPRRVLLCAHYDTRPIADQEPDPRRWRLPFIAANDGASGPAFLMELAQHLAHLELRVGVDFVLFDGEEYIFDPSPQERGGDAYFLGSEYFAKDYVQTRRKDAKKPVYIAAILVDMIAGKNPRFYYEQHSWTRAGVIAKQVWDIAFEVGATAFIPEVKHVVLDDHIALQRVGIPAIDIIDFDYPHWHRLTDVPANCSGEGMEQVARVLVVCLQRAR